MSTSSDFFILSPIVCLSLFFFTGYHGCLVNAIDCSHYCSIDNYGDAVCTCPEEYVLLEDKKTCACEKGMCIIIRCYFHQPYFLFVNYILNNQPFSF